jgi:hypothetical protein
VVAGGQGLHRALEQQVLMVEQGPQVLELAALQLSLLEWLALRLREVATGVVSSLDFCPFVTPCVM